MSNEIQIGLEEKGDVLIVRFAGRLDAVTSPPAERAMGEIIDGGKTQVLIDFAQVNYISSAGMRMLLAVTKKIASKEGKVIVCGIVDSVLDVLKMAGFNHILNIADTEESGLNEF
jgi:anti-anti-sigma factor